MVQTAKLLSQKCIKVNNSFSACLKLLTESFLSPKLTLCKLTQHNSSYFKAKILNEAFLTRRISISS